MTKTLPSWNCPDCGFSNCGEVIDCSGGCGHIHIPRKIKLVGVLSRNEITCGIDTQIGKALLSVISGEDSRFASTVQFTVKRCLKAKGWILHPNTGATNQSFINGKEITETEVLLSKGDVISIGPEKAKVEVHFE